MKLKKQLYNIYAKHTKQSLQVIGECPPSVSGAPRGRQALSSDRASRLGGLPAAVLSGEGAQP